MIGPLASALCATVQAVTALQEVATAAMDGRANRGLACASDWFVRETKIVCFVSRRAKSPRTYFLRFHQEAAARSPRWMSLMLTMPISRLLSSVTGMRRRFFRPM